MGARRQAREAALQILYLTDVGHLTPEEATVAFWDQNPVPDRVRRFAETLSAGVSKVRENLDTLIMKYAENWEIARMAAVDRNILRLAAFELVHQPETPVSVVIDEAVEIAKFFSTQDSGKFVNGILDKIQTERKPGSKSGEASEGD